jgi:hypothetical protein
VDRPRMEAKGQFRINLKENFPFSATLAETYNPTLCRPLSHPESSGIIWKTHIHLPKFVQDSIATDQAIPCPPSDLRSPPFAAFLAGLEVVRALFRTASEPLVVVPDAPVE